MKVLLVSEGKHELGDAGAGAQGALTVLVTRLIGQPVEITREKVSDRKIRVHAKSGKGGKLERRALAWVRYGRQEGFDAVVLVVDEDGDDGRQPQLDKAQNASIFHLPHAFGGAIRTFDAWMLPDEKAISRVLGMTIARQAEPETLKDPKQQCRDLSDSSEIGMSATTTYAAIAAEADLAIMAERCPKGFSPFAQRVKALQRP